MFAIPSPDVLVNLFASAAQVLGLAALCVGGGMAAKKRLPGAASGRPASRLPLTLSLLGLFGIGSWFLLYHLGVVDEENRRLQANLVRYSQEQGQRVGDTSLKTLSYSEQTKHPHAISTEEVQRWIDEGRPLNLIDVRETEETEMGGIPGTWARRYPDLQANRDGLIEPGKTTVLLCESGNRSSELHEYFLEQHGIETKFMMGGYEKWTAEDRPLMGARGSERTELRALPDFPNKEVLLTTEETTRLYLDENALFVDVRYPMEFEQGHLPGAVNVTLRKMQTHEWKEALAALPKRPIVAVCYDKRSSFFALILGVRLSRMGHDFRGRYTLPHEFALPTKEKEWVAAWSAANAERTLFGDVREAGVALLAWLRSGLGSLALAIAAAALALRLLLLPLSAKATRDAIVQRRHGAELAALQTQLADDPVRLRRATFGWLRGRKITPLRSLVAALLQLVLFTVLFSAVDRAASASSETLGWLSLSAPDALGIVPLACALLLGALVLLQSRTRRGRILGLAFVAGVTALVWICRGGAQLYLAVSFAALLAQELAVRWRLRERMPRAATPLEADGLVPLRAAAGRDELGGKASRLGTMLAAGFDVPDGFVVPNGYAPSPAELTAALVRLGGGRFAVRSSACGEDGAHHSFAGEFRTLLGIGAGEVFAAIAAVRASYAGRPGGVVVQPLVAADHAGVLFTEDPAHAGRALLEIVEGLGEGLVSGTATPTEHRFRRVTGERVDGDEPPFDLEPVLELGRRLERLFGVPQDVEWAREGARIVALQSRDVTRRAGHGTDPVAVRESERARLLALAAGASPEEPLFEADDHMALLPAPTTFSLALLQDVWGPGGSVDLACRRLGLGYHAGEGDPPYIASVFGRCFRDVRAARGRVRGGAGAAFRIASASAAIERGFAEFLPSFRRTLRRDEAIDLVRLDDAALFELVADTRRRFVTSTYVEAETINLAAEAYCAGARRRLRGTGIEACAAIGGGVTTVVQRAFAELSGAGTPDERRARFVAAFGHRAPHDFELSEPRFAADPAKVRELAEIAAQDVAAPRAAAEEPALRGRLLRAEVARARRFQELKEEAKDVAMRELAFLRAVLLEIGRRRGIGDLVFHLLPAEVERLADAEFAARAQALAADRRHRLAVLRTVELPDVLTPAALQRVGEQRPLQAIPPTGTLRGARVAGSGEVTGRVRVLHAPEQIRTLAPGEILVVRCTDPCWLPAFRIAGGLVSEIGGWLSHAAIQAREHGLPAVVGVRGATAQLRDGDVVRLGADGTVERTNARPASRGLAGAASGGLSKSAAAR